MKEKNTPKNPPQIRKRRAAISDEKKVVVKSLADTGMPYREIQKIVPISLGQISNIVKEFESKRELVDYYKGNRADLLAYDQIVYRGYITPEKLEKASARDLLTMIAILYDKERLERGQATENVSILVRRIKELQKKKWRELDEQGEQEKELRPCSTEQDVDESIDKEEQ